MITKRKMLNIGKTVVAVKSIIETFKLNLRIQKIKGSKEYG